MDLISSMPRAGETVLRGWADDQSLESAVAMRHRADKHLRRTMLRGGTNQVVARNHLTRVEHADAVRSMRTMEYRRPGKRAARPTLGAHVFHCGFRQTPGPYIARVWADARLDAVDGARPFREAHIMRAVPC